MSLPFPVPQTIVDEADKLGGESYGPGKAQSSPVFVIHLLNANGDSVFVSPALTGSQLKSYVYEFNVRVNLLKWWIRLELSWTYQDQKYFFSTTFVVPVGTITPKGSGARVHIGGKSISTNSACKKLRLRLASALKGSSAVRLGYPTSSPLRPNELRTAPFTDRIWNRSSSTAPWNEGTVAAPALESYHRTWTGTRTPGFGGLGKRQLPVNPHTVDIGTTKQPPCFYGSHNVANGSANGEMRRWTKYFSGATQPTHNSAADAIALKRLLDNAGLERQNLAETVATLGQTFDMIHRNVDRIRKAVSSLKKGNLPSAVKELWGNASPRYRRRRGLKATKDLAGLWLELQYGWKPLINDVHWGMQKLSEVNLSEFQVVRTAASARKRETTEVSVGTVQNTGGKVGGSTKVETLSMTRYVVHWRMSDPLLSLIAEAGFTNPVSLAWELVPFSFVVDWFLPLGTFFEQLSAWDGLIFLRGSKTQFTKQWTDSAVNYVYTSPFNANVRLWGQGSYHNEWVRLDRVKLTAFPGSVIHPPKVGLNSATRIANAIALLRQVATKV